MLFISTWESSRSYSKPTYVMYNGLPCLVPPGINNKPIEIPEGDIIGKQISDLQKQKEELLAALKEVVYCSENFGKAYAGRDARDKAKALIKRIDHA